jgi:hypothetical protein
MTRLKTLWHLLNLPCRDMTRLASESLDRELGGLERAVLRIHLLYCAGCRRYLEQIVEVRTILHRAAARIAAGGDLPGLGLPDDVRSRIKQTLREN